MLKHKLPGPDGRLPAYTLTELLVVLVIIGILVLLALPNQGEIIGRAYATEAKLQLNHLYSLEKAHFFEYSRYSDNLADIGYSQEELISNGGNARYRIEPNLMWFQQGAKPIVIDL